MVQIQLGNSKSLLKAPFHLFSAIQEELSYEVEGAHFATQHNPYWDGKIKLLKKNGEFPTGLLSKVVRFCKMKELPYQIDDLRVKPATKREFVCTFPEPIVPRYYQNEAVGRTDIYSRGVFVVGTGGGKTVTAAMVIDKFKQDTLFVTPDTDLRDQAFEDFAEWFGADAVGMDVKDEHPIVVQNIQSLARRDKKFFKRFKMVVIDEFHHSAAKTYQKINHYCENAYYRYGFTGTFLRSDGADMEMHGVLSSVIFKKTTSELIEEGFLVRPYITVVRYETRPEYGRNCNYKTAYDHIVQDAGFHQVSAEIANKKISEGKQTLIVVRRIEHGEALQEIIPQGIFVHGTMDKKERQRLKKAFINKEIPCLIATNIFGEGTDIPSIDVFINCRCEKTEIQTKQGIGRALRKADGKDKAEVYDFLIIGQKHLENHSVERIGSYKKESAFRIKFVRDHNIWDEETTLTPVK